MPAWKCGCARSGQPTATRATRAIRATRATGLIPMSAKNRIRVARVYDDPDPDDGRRVLVDRLWPRGFRKDDPRVGTWLKDVAPSKELREWYNHQPERFDQFTERYREELDGSAALGELRKLAKSGVVTLVTATRHVQGSHAAVLATLLKSG
jgi:uncharacterized protein YeaO (DUF488 family)